jgi:hypothetical protein
MSHDTGGDGQPEPQPTASLLASEQLMHCTIKLEVTDPAGATGTGFLYTFHEHEGRSLPAIITNTHVVRGARSIKFSLTKKGKDQSPQYQSVLPVRLDDIQRRTINHPDADLSAIVIGDVLESLVQNGNAPFLVALGRGLIPSAMALRELSPLETVLTVGYPGQLWDDVNNLPIFHRGNTATAPYIDFKGKKEFLVDFATWPGASGSPVFVFNEGSVFNSRTGSLSLGQSRVLLIGVVYGVAVQEVTGNVVVQQGPTSFSSTPLLAASNVPTNLGVCLRAERIIELERFLFNLGILAPAGYNPASIS